MRITFFRGAEMQDFAKILEAPGENSQSARYIRFTDTQSIAPLKSTILSYIQEAIALEKSKCMPQIFSGNGWNER